MKKIYTRIEYLGYYQIIGGIIGILIGVLYNYQKLLTFNGFFLFSVSLFICLNGFSIYSGVLLVQKKYLKGLKLSAFVQSSQIVGFIILGYIFEFAIGLCARLRIELTNDIIVGFDFGIIKWGLSRSANPDLVEIKFNIVPIVLLIYISRYISRMKIELNKKNEAE